jgi:predicted RNase H-like HicB family nuclease
MQPVYTIVFRKDANVCIALCLENGIVGQGESKELALERLMEATASWEEARTVDPDIHSVPIAISELHEFLLSDHADDRSYELKAVYA